MDTNLEFMRLAAVLERRAKSRSVFYREVETGICTPPVKIGRNAVWPRHEINALMGAELNGASQDQLRRLVAELVTQRKAMLPAALREAEAA